MNQELLQKVKSELPPLKGSFYCEYKLVSLEGAPKKVGGLFDCSHKKLASLKGAPKYIGVFFDTSSKEKHNNNRKPLSKRY